MRIPTSVWSPFGPMPVTYNARLTEDQSAWGMTEWRDRKITLDSKACRATMVHTFFHELIHVPLWDSGTHNILTHEQTEAVCDAVGGYFAQMALAGYLTIRKPEG